MRVIETPIIEGFVRAYKQCRLCDKVATYDYIPYSLSSAVLVPPCVHDFRTDYKSITKAEFYAAVQAELLPCPFCGATANLPDLHKPKNGRTQRPVWEISCSQFCVSMIRGSKKTVIEDWNRRASHEPH